MQACSRVTPDGMKPKHRTIASTRKHHKKVGSAVEHRVARNKFIMVRLGLSTSAFIWLLSGAVCVTKTPFDAAWGTNWPWKDGALSQCKVSGVRPVSDRIFARNKSKVRVSVADLRSFRGKTHIFLLKRSTNRAKWM